MKDVILIFDIPKAQGSVKVKVWRDLIKINAEKIQHSVWKSDKFETLVEIASFIEKNGGSASILEVKFIF